MSTSLSILVMNHGRFGEELIASAEMIIGKIEDIHAVSLMPGMSIEEFYEKAEAAVSRNGENTLILTDLFGGTPCNVAMMLRQKYHVKILCGMNLPMLIELVSSKDVYGNVEELMDAVLDTARSGIFSPEETDAEDDL